MMNGFAGDSTLGTLPSVKLVKMNMAVKQIRIMIPSINIPSNCLIRISVKRMAINTTLQTKKMQILPRMWSKVFIGWLSIQKPDLDIPRHKKQ